MGEAVDGNVTSVRLSWRGPLDDVEMLDLVNSHGGHPERGWWDKIRQHSLGWVTARSSDGALVERYYTSET